MERYCIICGEKFNTKVHNQICCSKKCMHINSHNNKKKHHNRVKEDKRERLLRMSEKYRIPVNDILEYGEDFILLKNVLEVLQAKNRLGGKFTFLTEEEKTIRKRAVERSCNKRYREKKGYKKKCCVICNKEFTAINKSNSSKTCSEHCSLILKKNNVKICGQRRTLKKKLNIK